MEEGGGGAFFFLNRTLIQYQAKAMPMRGKQSKAKQVLTLFSSVKVRAPGQGYTYLLGQLCRGPRVCVCLDLEWSRQEKVGCEDLASYVDECQVQEVGELL